MLTCIFGSRHDVSHVVVVLPSQSEELKERKKSLYLTLKLHRKKST